jgi:hypothetical protein
MPDGARVGTGGFAVNGGLDVDRLSAVEQSIYVEVELHQIFGSFALALYNDPAAQTLWRRLGDVHADIIAALSAEKWRIVREDLDAARITYGDESLLREFKRFDSLRGAIVHPVTAKAALELAAKALDMAAIFHDDRIMIADFGLAENLIRAIGEGLNRQMETIAELRTAPDLKAASAQLDLEKLDLAVEE